MPTQPAVSVIIPCYKQAGLLPEAVRSVVEQSVTNVEAIIVDDGSPDNASEVADELSRRWPQYVRWTRQPNGGLSSARNRGIGLSRGEYLLFLDSDDVIRPSFLKNHLEAAARHSRLGQVADIICGGVRYVDVAADGTESFLYDLPPPTFADDPFHTYIFGNAAACHAHLVARRVVEKIGGFDTKLKSHEDWDFWLRAAKAGARFVAAEGQDSIYRQFAGSMSRNRLRMLETTCAVLVKHSGTHFNCRICEEALRIQAGAMLYSWTQMLREYRLPLKARYKMLSAIFSIDSRAPRWIAAGIGRHLSKWAKKSDAI